ncbi:hypothetical protein B0H17DRAFT_1124758 [Mycena rosella]|uniref:Uncharacterized protein n=1 Tax=Mycena rosella TaxID=1033263 RepID=A0AAD7H0C6_MYCRO|nr:hypothetical protein B0H17DRAFT_1124758 [Mycena rosella]
MSPIPAYHTLEPFEINRQSIAKMMWAKCSCFRGIEKEIAHGVILETFKNDLFPHKHFKHRKFTGEEWNVEERLLDFVSPAIRNTLKGWIYKGEECLYMHYGEDVVDFTEMLIEHVVAAATLEYKFGYCKVVEFSEKHYRKYYVTAHKLIHQALTGKHGGMIEDEWDSWIAMDQPAASVSGEVNIVLVGDQSNSTFA